VKRLIIICWTVRNKPERSLQGCKANGPTNDKHTPAHKCFALNDLRNRVVYNSALPGPEAKGRAEFI